MYTIQYYSLKDQDDILKTWIDSLLQINLKLSISDLTEDEINDEINEIKGTISNEKLWALTDDIHYDNIALHEKYIRILENELTRRANT